MRITGWSKGGRRAVAHAAVLGSHGRRWNAGGTVAEVTLGFARAIDGRRIEVVLAPEEARNLIEVLRDRLEEKST